MIIAEVETFYMQQQISERETAEKISLGQKFPNADSMLNEMDKKTGNINLTDESTEEQTY